MAKYFLLSQPKSKNSSMAMDSTVRDKIYKTPRKEIVIMLYKSC